MRTTTRSTTARLAIGLASVIALAACGGDDDDVSSATTTEAEITDPTTTSSDVETTDAVGTTDAVETTEASETTEATETTDASDTTDGSDTTEASADGSPYTSPEGDFSVVFPGEPTVQSQDQALPDGSTMELVLAGYEFDDGFVATARGVYPDTYVFDVPTALQGGQDQALANTGGTLLTSQDITLQGRPGREFSATITNGSQTGTQLQRVYLDGLVIYQQIFTGPGEVTFSDPEVATFFDSFAFATG